MKLIREVTENVQYLTELTESGSKKLFIEGVFLVGDQVNRNNRMYKMDTLRKEVHRYTEELINNNRALGELGHPQNPSLNLERVSHKIVSLKENGNTFVGKALILETPYGQIAKNLIDNGVKLGVSSRALGTLSLNKEGYSVVNDDLKIFTAADIVADPSGPNCFVGGIMEGKEFWYDLARNSWIEKDVEILYDNIKKFPKHLIEEQALNMFNWYLTNLCKK